MKKEQVEIYANTPSDVVIRHPDMKYPGTLIQGDLLKILIADIEEAKTELSSENTEEAMDILNDIAERLQDKLNTYLKATDDYNF